MDQNTNYNQPQIEDDEPIDWALYLGILLKNWRKIAKITFICGVLGVCVALVQKRTWQVSLTLAPEIQQRGGSSSLSGIASMLGMGGMQLGAGTDAMGITMFPDICSSTPFLTGLFDVRLTPYITKEQELDGVVAVPTTVREHMLGEDKPKGWFKELMESWFPVDSALLEDENIINVSKLTKKQSAVVIALSKMVSVDVDKKTGVTTVSVIFDDPQMATQLADSVCDHLTKYIFEYRTQKERENLDYYDKMCEEAKANMIAAQEEYGRSVDYNRSVQLISQSAEKTRLQNEAQIATQLYSQMVQQRELTRAKLQEAKPVFAVVQPATFPIRPMQSRKNTVFIIAFLGFALSAGWFVIGKEYYEKFLAELKEKNVIK